MRTRHCLLLVAIALPLGCGEASDGATELDRAPIYPLELEMRIGSVDDPDLGLTRVTDVLFDDDERVYIAESSQRQIRVYDIEGNLLRRIGRDGEGPGEFRSVYDMGFLGDTLFVTDGSLHRVSTFTGDGDFISSFTWMSRAPEISPPVFYVPTTPSVILPDGSGVVMQSYGYVPGEVDELPIPWLRIDRTGETMDTILLLRVPIPTPETLNENGEEFMFGGPIPEGPLYELMPDRSGTIVLVERRASPAATTHTFRMLRIDVNGDTVFLREYEYTPVPTPAGEAERQAKLVVERYETSSLRRTAPSVEGVTRIYSKDGFIPAYQPPISAIRTGQDGSVWLQRERLGADSVTWTRIAEDGSIDGAVRLAEGARIMAARADLIAVLELDELDVPFLSVFRISPQAD